MLPMLCARRGEHRVAEEYYTSALLQWDREPIFLTNRWGPPCSSTRAQARIHQGRHQQALDDCKEAIKLKQDSLKTIVVAVRALRGMKDFQKAMDMLEVAEQIPGVDMATVDSYRREVTKEMKEHLLKI